MQKWINRRLCSQQKRSFMQELASFPEIYEAVQYIDTLFDLLPKGIADLFRCLARPSPVCSYVLPLEDVYGLRDKIFTPSIKEDVIFMKELSEKAPVIFRLLSAFQIETSMPYAFKQLFGKLIFLSRKPFQNDGEASNPENFVCNSEYLMDFFPKLPKLRPRGVYESDKLNSESVCAKKYSSHKKLTAGIFTIYCVHGKLLTLVDIWSRLHFTEFFPSVI